MKLDPSRQAGVWFENRFRQSLNEVENAKRDALQMRSWRSGASGLHVTPTSSDIPDQPSRLSLHRVVVLEITEMLMQLSYRVRSERTGGWAVEGADRSGVVRLVRAGAGGFKRTQGLAVSIGERTERLECVSRAGCTPQRSTDG